MIFGGEDYNDDDDDDDKMILRMLCKYHSEYILDAAWIQI